MTATKQEPAAPLMPMSASPSHADLDLRVSDLWPDGNVPDVITAEAIATLMREQGTKTHVLVDWNLINEVSVSVRVDAPNPGFSQYETLFGEPPPARLLTRVREVWD